MKPETEIRNLKRELKNAREKARLDVSMKCVRIGELELRVKELQLKLSAAERDNQRLAEIAELCRRLAGEPS